MNFFKIIFVAIVLLEYVKTQEVNFTVDAVVGRIAELPCNVTAEAEDDKLDILAWYRYGSPNAFYSRDLRSEEGTGDISSVDAPGRYRLVLSEEEGLDKLQILSVLPSDEGLYKCFANFAASPAHNTYVELRVIEPPQHMWVVHDNGTDIVESTAGGNASKDIGPYYIGDIVRLVCVVYRGKPQPTIQWLAGSQPVKKPTLTPLSDVRLRSDMRHGPLRREDHGLVLTCAANNNDYTPDIHIDIVVNMYLPPQLVSIRAVSGADSGVSLVSGLVREGDALRLECRVLGARPAPRVLWRRDDEPLLHAHENITTKPAQRLLVSEVSVVAVRELDEAHVTCCAPAYSRASEQYACAEPMHLTVLYAPVLKIAVEGHTNNNSVAVVKNSNVTINCTFQANPSVYRIIWFHEDDIKSTQDANGQALQQASLELSDASESDAGEYVCSAINDEGTAYSEPILVDVIYPAYCTDVSTAEYGVGENESINLTCNVKANPEPASYRWVFTNYVANTTTFKNTQPHSTLQTDNATLLYERPNATTFNTIFCWGQNGVFDTNLPHTPCTFLVTDETAPRPPADCVAVRTALGDITVTCEKGHDGGLPQKFKFTAQQLDSEDELVSITSLEPKFIIEEPAQEQYKFIIVASNDKGVSKAVEIDKESIIEESAGNMESKSAVADITTLALALCGGVALVALAACGLVLCAHERGSRADLPRVIGEPPLCAYNTEESNCETFNDSDDSNDCNVRRTESFKRAVTRYPSKNFDVRRTSSFHSARYLHDMAEPDSGSKCNDMLRHNCRVHSMQNVSRKREMDGLCDHLVMQLPPEANYHVPKPMNTFYTMPRKMRNKMAKQISDDASEITQNSDGFSLPPPPDEFGTYRAATRIKDMPAKSTPTYTTIVKKSSGREPPKQNYSNVIISPMNTVGLPTVSGGQSSLYTYPDDGHSQVNTNPFEDSS